VSGRKQHHIPQFFLKAFEASGAGRKKQVWVFFKDKKFKSSTEGVAAERSFYSEILNDGTKTLDDVITEYEKTAAAQTTRLRSFSVGDVVDPKTAAEAIAHLTIRNAHLRRSLVGGARQLAEGAADLFCNESNLRLMLGVDARAFPEAIARAVDEHLASDPRYAATGLPRDLLLKIGFMVMKENFNRFVANTLPHMKMALAHFADSAPEHLRTGHNKALSQGMAPDARVAALRALHWTIQASPGSGAILPDCVALGIEDEGVPQPLIMVDLEKLTRVIMPLTPDRLLIGSRYSTSVDGLADFNKHAAACSHDFFICNSDDGLNDDLMKSIGTRAQETINQAITLTFDEFKKKRAVVKDAAQEVNRQTEAPRPDDPQFEPPVLAPLEFEMRFRGVANDETAMRIASVLRGIVHELRPMMALDRLDGFTFAEDYEAELFGLVRGFDAPPPISTKEDYGVGVAMSPIIVRDGVVKSRIVARLWIGLGLISENEEHQKASLHLIINQLAHVSCVQLLDEALPGFYFSPIKDSLDAFLYPRIAEAWTGYCGSRASAIFDPGSETAYLELVMSALRRAQESIPAARLAYRFDGDLNKLLGVALPAVTALLKHVGNLLGHCDGLRHSPFENKQFETALEIAGLRSWIEFFRADLAFIWDRRGEWRSIDEFLLLNRHVERLLWQFGLFPRKSPDGKIWVHVPLSTDVVQLQGWRPILLRLWQKGLAWVKGIIGIASI